MFVQGAPLGLDCIRNVQQNVHIFIAPEDSNLVETADASSPRVVKGDLNTILEPGDAAHRGA